MANKNISINLIENSERLNDEYYSEDEQLRQVARALIQLTLKSKQIA